MIFVAVGTASFSALIKAVDELAPALNEEVVMQIGRSLYEPKNCEYFRFAPSLTSFYERASLVISHGGLGIVTEVIGRGLPLVAVENPDVTDRHQTEILSVWDQDKHLVWCRGLIHLSQAIEKAKGGLIPYSVSKCQIHTIIGEFLDKLVT
jgi:UDP-N-acetylglucosamine transferase subunit ALG13